MKSTLKFLQLYCVFLKNLFTGSDDKLSDDWFDDLLQNMAYIAISIVLAVVAIVLSIILIIKYIIPTLW